MTDQDYELLSQYLDGELSEPAALELTQRLATEPQLSETLKRLQQSDNTLKSAFSGPEAEAVPAPVAAMVAGTRPKIVPLPHRQRRAANWGFALAASLLVATSALLVSQLQLDSDSPGATTDTLLAEVLEQSHSSGHNWNTLPDGRQFRSVLSFQSNSGHWCREYWLASNQDSAHGVACRDNNRWITKVQVSAQLIGTSSEYRPAGATDSDRVAEFMTNHATDIALGAQEEAELIANRWQ